MARLAAYYQEDFHYPSQGIGHNQRKPAYIFYDEPKNNVFNSYSFNKERIKNLATSEPSLDLPQMQPEAMAFQRQAYQHPKHIYQNYPYQYEYSSNHPQLNQYYARYEPEVCDNESMFFYNVLPQHDNQHNQRYKNRSRKRYSFAEPIDLHSPNLVYIPHNVQRHRTKESRTNNLQYCDDQHYHPDSYFLEPNSQYQSTPHHIRPESRQEHWQNYHFIKANANPVFLSPPSPLDSGLSSQSIGSNPSLDAEHSSEHIPVIRSGRHSSCSCTRLAYCDDALLTTPDFGEVSPITNPVSHRAVASSPQRHKRSASNHRKHAAEDYDVSTQCENQVRYGKMGLVGEQTDNQQRTNFEEKKQECEPQKRKSSNHSNENFVLQQKPLNFKRNKSFSGNYSRPCTIVINGPNKSNRQLSSSPDDREELSDDKGPESPMSVTVSNSDSAPSSIGQDHPPRNKTPLKRRSSVDKAAELEIRELEAMYARCNLSDRDLLDRAERRDLPTAHQQSRLTRSISSDALCQTSLRGNPYEPIRRAPPLRRSGLPDRFADDMAMRKLQRNRYRSNLVDNTITYMLCSAHFTPSVQPSERDVLLMGNPDVDLDDLCYRKHYLGKKTKQDPEPPFGIPLRPPPTQKVCISDYLHAVPSQAPQPLCHPKGNPDVVRDDMAFRTLRKDEPDRVYYDISQIYRHKKVFNN